MANAVLLHSVPKPPTITDYDVIPRCASHCGIQPVAIRKEMRFVAEHNDAGKLAPLSLVSRECIGELKIQDLFAMNMPVAISIEVDDVTGPSSGFDF